jgi:glutaryl-CoA dehydrogenase
MPDFYSRGRDLMNPPATNGVTSNGSRQAVEPPVLGTAEHTDYYLVDELLTDEQRALRAGARRFMDSEVAPIMNSYWERAEFPFALLPKLAQMNLAGFQIQGYRCPGMSNVTAGLAIMEIARGDLSVATFLGVQSSFAMMSIALLGSEDQKQRLLPAMARLEKIGAFGLTEPYHGTDVVVREATGRREGDAYVLNGYKRCIGNAAFAEYVIIWARGDDGHVAGTSSKRACPGSMRKPSREENCAPLRAARADLTHRRPRTTREQTGQQQRLPR